MHIRPLETPHPRTPPLPLLPPTRTRQGTLFQLTVPLPQTQLLRLLHMHIRPLETPPPTTPGPSSSRHSASPTGGCLGPSATPTHPGPTLWFPCASQTGIARTTCAARSSSPAPSPETGPRHARPAPSTTPSTASTTWRTGATATVASPTSSFSQSLRRQRLQIQQRPPRSLQSRHLSALRLLLLSLSRRSPSLRCLPRPPSRPLPLQRPLHRLPSRRDPTLRRQSRPPPSPPSPSQPSPSPLHPTHPLPPSPPLPPLPLLASPLRSPSTRQTYAHRGAGTR